MAYAAFAAYINASKQERSDIIYSYIGTQANKLPDAVDAMVELMNNMPEARDQFEAAKKSALKKIAAQRITKSSIFWNYESLKKRGLDYDIRKEMYSTIEEMNFEDLNEFFEESIKGGEYTALVIGKKSDLDLNALKKLGEVKELDIDYLFNYKETEVKQ